MKLRISRRTQKILGVSLLAGLIVCISLSIRLFNILIIEDWFEAKIIGHMRNFGGGGKFDPNVKIILIRKEQKDGPVPSGEGDRKHREFFANLITAMIDAKARVLALDVYFEGNSPDFDQKISDALAKAEDAGLKVIVGVNKIVDGKPVPEIPEVFKQPRWGMIEVASYQGSDRAVGPIRAMKLAENYVARDGKAGLFHSLALRSVIESRKPPLVPELQSDRNRLLLYADESKKELVQTIPLDRGNYMILDQALRSDLDGAIVDARSVYDDFKDKKALERKYENAIVLMGYEMGESLPILSGGERLGVELHATAVSNILGQVYVYKLLLIYSYLIVFFMALLAGVMYTSIGKWLDYKILIPIPWTDLKLPIPVGLMIIGALYSITAALVFIYARIYLDVAYHLAALLLSYGLLWLVLKKIPFSRDDESVIDY